MINLQGERRLLGEPDSGLELFAGKTASHIDEDDLNEEDTGRRSLRKARIAQGQSGIDIPEIEDEESDDDDYASDEEEIVPEVLGGGTPGDGDVNWNGEQEVAFADSDSDLGSVSSVEDQILDDGEGSGDGSEDDGELRWKGNLQETALNLHGRRRPYQILELAKL